jgi:hypothetical protein
MCIKRTGKNVNHLRILKDRIINDPTIVPNNLSGVAPIPPKNDSAPLCSTKNPTGIPPVANTKIIKR